MAGKICLMDRYDDISYRNRNEKGKALQELAEMFEMSAVSLCTFYFPILI